MLSRSFVVAAHITCQGSGRRPAAAWVQVLNLSSSNITGALPLTWGSSGALPALVQLDLSHNAITGTLPTSWSASNSLPQLHTLGLTDNLLEGSLPGSWGSQSQSFPSLEVLDVALNNLSGTLPAAWCGEGFPVSTIFQLPVLGTPLTRSFALFLSLCPAQCSAQCSAQCPALQHNSCLAQNAQHVAFCNSLLVLLLLSSTLHRCP